MVRAPLIALMAAVLVGCGGEADETIPPVEPPGCEAPEVALPDGSCLRPGVPPGGCAEGFVHDGEYGCEPILPAEPCPEGSMALPGETECHPVMACGDGVWGDIPVDATTIYVDASYSGGSDGSAAAPYTSIAAALDAAADGALVAVAAGSYAEDVLVQKRVRLWGVCPERTIIAGAGVIVGALTLAAGASGAEAHGFAVTGDNTVAVAISGATDVQLTHLWVHDATGRGLTVQGSLGPTSAALQHTLIEHSHEYGVFVAGAEVSLDGLVVRDTLPRQSDLTLGRGINIQADDDTGIPTTATITASLVERSHELGVFVSGAEVSLDGLIVRDISPLQSDLTGGRGINIQDAPDTSFLSKASVTASLVERSHEFAVFVSGAEASLDGLVVRDTLPQQSDLTGGYGIAIQTDPNTNAPASATVTTSLVERSHELGVNVSGAEASLEALVIRDTLPQQGDLTGGRGLGIQVDVGTGAPSTATVTASLIERNHEIGVFVAGSEVSLEALVVRDTLPQQSDQHFGRGINIQNAPGISVPPVATVTASLVERSYDIGLVVAACDATLQDVAIRKTIAREFDGHFGDGLMFVSEGGPATAVVTNVLVDGSDRAGLSNFGAHVTLGASTLTCNAFDLTGESFLEQSFVFDDVGQNGCGCPEPSETCKAVSAGLEPPESVDDTM